MKKHARRELLPQQILACGCPSGQNTNYVTLGRLSPDSIILWTGWLVGNTQCLCYMSSSQNTMTSVYGEVDDNKILDLVCGHGLIKIHCYTGIEKILGSQQMFHMIPLEQMELPKPGLKFESGCVKTELGVEWPSPAVQITLNKRLSEHGTPNKHLRSHAGGNMRICRRWLRQLRP